MKFNSPKKSLSDLLGKDYIESVVSGVEAFGLMSREEALKIANEKVDFYPEEAQKKKRGVRQKGGRTIDSRF